VAFITGDVIRWVEPVWKPKPLAPQRKAEPRSASGALGRGEAHRLALACADGDAARALAVSIV